MEFVNRVFQNSSTVFTKEYLNEYINDPRTQSMLNGIVLLNYDDFFNWYNGIDENQNEDLSDDLVYSEDADTKYGVKDRTKFLDMAKVICHNIGYEYGISTLNSLVKRPETLDILVAVTPDYMNTNFDKSAAYNRYVALRNKILGFIVVEKGECKIVPDIYCLRLICTKQEAINGFKIKGSVLLGAFLYCLKSDITKKQYALLELANGYRNLPGFFAYSKFGFEKEMGFFAPDCFTEYGNLPMIVDLRETYADKQSIIEVMVGEKPIPNDLLQQKDVTNLVFTGIPKNGKQFGLQSIIVNLAEELLSNEIDYMVKIYKLTNQMNREANKDTKYTYEQYVSKEKEKWERLFQQYRKKFESNIYLYRMYDNDRDTLDYLEDSYDTLPVAEAEPEPEDDRPTIVFSDHYGGLKRTQKHKKTYKRTKYRKKANRKSHRNTKPST
jgi:hypothetical protein